MEEKQNADTGNSGASSQGNQPDKDAKTQSGSSSNQPERSSNQPERQNRVPQYGRPNKRQYPNRGQQQGQGKEQTSGKEQQQGKPQDRASSSQDRASSQDRTSQEQQGKSQEQPATADRQQQQNPAVNKIIPPKGPKKVRYNSSRYRGKPYANKESQTPAASTGSTAVAPRKTSFRKISVVIPLLNEEESLRPLANEIKKVMRTTTADYEVIFVDDGSTDKSLKVIKEIARMDPKFKYISFRKNYGKSAALQMGFKQATGDVIITMDADLQDDPNEIPNLLHKLEEGYDLVSGWKKERFDPFIKRHSSKFFNYVTGVMSGIDIHDFNCGLKAYRKDVVKDLKVYGELHRYMPVLADWQGYRISEVPVKHHPRRYGKTKFGISRFFKGFIDLVTVMFTTRYIKRPMHLFGFLGAIAFLIGFIVNGYLSIEWMMGKSLSNRPLLFFGMLLIIVGIQFFSVGLLGEMMVHNFQSDKEYSIKDKG